MASKGTALKGSEHEIDRFGSSYVEKVADKPVSREADSSKLNQMGRAPVTFTETVSVSSALSSGSDQRNVPDTLVQNATNNSYGPVDYLSKSNPVQKPPISTPIPAPVPVQESIPSYMQSSNQSQNLYGQNKPQYGPVGSQAVPTKDYSAYPQQNSNISSGSSFQASKYDPIPTAKPASSSFESNLGSSSSKI